VFLLPLVPAVIVNSFAFYEAAEYRVLYIVPAGYRGLVIIELDEQNGIEPKVRGIRRVYRIGPDGRCRSSRAWHVLRSHSFEARYADGTELVNGVNADDDQVALRRVLSRDDEGVLWLLVGTAAEKDAAQRELLRQKHE
jgi:hypothetical protein